MFGKNFPLRSQHQWCSISALCKVWTAQGRAIFSLCVLETINLIALFLDVPNENDFLCSSCQEKL